jgi:succinoglycan biosynthesis transport protein ExoP
MNSIGPSSSLTKRSSPSLSFAAAEASASGIATVSESQTLSGLLRILRRRWKAVCFFTVIVFVLGTIGLFLITPQYASTSTIEVSRVDQEDTAIHETANTSIADELKTEIHRILLSSRVTFWRLLSSEISIS